MIRLQWIGGEHDFALDIGQMRALQTACDAGPEQILRRMTAGHWRVNDLFDTIRLGLIGGGMAEKEASALVAMVEEQHGIGPLVPLAQAVLLQAFYRREVDDESGEMTRPTDAPPTVA